jgi:hypothetical protein
MNKPMQRAAAGSRARQSGYASQHFVDIADGLACPDCLRPLRPYDVEAGADRKLSIVCSRCNLEVLSAVRLVS